MKKIGFAEAVAKITARDHRYESEAYAFVRDALDFTIKLRRKGSGKEEEHRNPSPRELAEGLRPCSNVSGQELLEGVRQYALKEFGPMVVTVLAYWGIHKCEDVGQMVFNLIEEGIFGKSDHDTIDDFKNGFDFKEAFVEPYLPPKTMGRQGGKFSGTASGATAEKVK